MKFSRAAAPTTNSQTLVVGTPAEHALKLRDGYRKLVRARSAVAVAATLGLLWTISNPAMPLIVSGACAALAAMFYMDASRYGRLRAKAEVGAVSELRVAEVINQCGAQTVLHGMLLGAGGDCDHVIAGNTLIALETKTGRGFVQYRDGHLIAGQRVLPGDPVAQARRQAAALGRIAHAHASAIVVVVDMTNDAFQAGDVLICSLRQLPSLIASAPRPTGPNELARVLRHAQTASTV